MSGTAHVQRTTEEPLISAQAQASLGPEDIAQLGHWLREHELPVDPGQLIASARLLSGQAAPLPATELGPWLAPLLSTNATEQTRFHELYADWLAARGLGPPRPIPPV